MTCVTSASSRAITKHNAPSLLPCPRAPDMAGFAPSSPTRKSMSMTYLRTRSTRTFVSTVSQLIAIGTLAPLHGKIFCSRKPRSLSLRMACGTWSLRPSRVTLHCPRSCYSRSMTQRRINGARMATSTMRTAEARRTATDSSTTWHTWNLCLTLFYSLNRFLQHEGHVGTGSVEM
jgi:hypothetical protein